MQVQQEQKPINIKASIDCKTTARDLQPWDAQTEILRNTGIERDGGITNLFQAIESNVAYEETFYTRNGNRVSLQRDDLNDNYHVYSNDREIGQVPQWGVASRELLSIDANDVMATIDGTFLTLRIAANIATIEEIDGIGYDFIRSRSFTIPADVSDGMFVRNKQPTWANVTSIVGIFASGTKLNHKVITDAGTVYAIAGQLGFVNSAQVFAYYENGWIVSSNDRADGRTFLLNAAGVQQGTYTEAVLLVANYARLANTISFTGWRDVVALGTSPGTYGNTFTPPAVPLGVWVITALTNGASSVVALTMTQGGYALAYGTATKNLFYANNTATRLWAIGHSTPPEIYGYLDNGAEIAFKGHTVLGAASYISACYNPDGIGLPITEVGELSSLYYPHILKATDGDYRIVYRRGDSQFGVIKMSKAITVSRMQEIAPGVVKINCTSELCLADSNVNDLKSSGNAYNGFIVVGFDAVAPLTQKAYIARYRGPYGGSVDSGYKSTGAVTVGAVNLLVRPEGLPYSPNNEVIDIYVGTPPNPEYYRSLRGALAQSVNSRLQGTIYVDDSIIPPPAGAIYSEQTIQLIGSTAIREFNYDGYQLLNETVGQYISFRLYGQLYLFDGDWIHAAQLSANVLQRLDHVTNALGLVFLAESPTSAFFYSSFDNSVYTFDGGQSVAKFLRFNRKGRIYTGAYNVRENTLGLFLDDSVLWIRDGIISESLLPFVYPYEIFSTNDGIWIAKNSYAVKYLYNAIAFGPVVPVVSLIFDGGIWGTVYPDIIDGGSWGVAYPDMIDGATWGTGATGTVVPLIWQSKFNGYSDRVRQNIDRMLFRVLKEDLVQSILSIEYQTYREDGQNTETRDIVIGDAVNPYDPDGYALVEFVPSNRNAIASSIKITCLDKIILLDGYATITTAGDTVAKNRG